MDTNLFNYYFYIFQIYKYIESSITISFIGEQKPENTRETRILIWKVTCMCLGGSCLFMCHSTVLFQNVSCVGAVIREFLVRTEL